MLSGSTNAIHIPGLSHGAKSALGGMDGILILFAMTLENPLGGSKAGGARAAGA